ncbi:hypothetical protein FK220_002065 [Flavobacteriaceae bacterium TP-CH-4]|uniref:Uncharacterized protein n=1 Tax=Pelagihabitans pacificus TaxID=2696054 RepID=A0A967APT3_9FLAO|nr:hypothetical protein [Pelagihabitans pacificus]NHF58109.1 hypothetical protein [Pelagihabitans pacificus]
MRKNEFAFAFVWIVPLLVFQLKAQKPAVQVIFEMEPDIVFIDTFDGELDAIKDGALPILRDGLEEYIGFVNFVTDSVPNTLKITLRSKSVGTMGLSQEYWLFLELADADDNVYEHAWQYLDNDEFNAVSSSKDALLEKLYHDWEAYLQKSYNQELVTHLFDEISLPLPDSSHYYIDADSGIKEAILPFKKEILRINPDKSEFRVIVSGETGSGVPATSTEPVAHASGEVVPLAMGVPEILKGCIRIELKTLSLNRLLNGKVYITDYMRKTYDDETIATSADFFESNPDRP